ncbi:MAG: hypothetical protein AB7V27_04115 [Candidatus Binatia bacterium]
MTFAPAETFRVFGSGGGGYVTYRVAAVVVGALAQVVLCTEYAAAIEMTAGGRPLYLTGWAMIRQGIRVESSTPDDRTLEQLWVNGRYAPTAGISLNATVNAQNGGPTTKRTKAGVYSYREVFQSVSPSVTFEEATVEISHDSLELRAGLQKFAWGKLDRIQPVDVLNTERFADPFLLEEDERKIGVPGVLVSHSVSGLERLAEDARLTLVWIPQYFPYLFPRPGERWYPPAARPPATFPVPPLMQSIPVGFHVVNAPAPSFQLANSGYAARASAFSGGVDYAAYYYHGFDNRPAFRLTAEASGQPSPVPPFVRDVAATTKLYPVFRNIDLWGADAAMTWDRFTFRIEAAFVSGRPFARDIRFLLSDPTQLSPEIARVLQEISQGISPVSVALPPSFAVRSAFEWGLGVDYGWEDTLLLLQVNQTDVLHNDVDLLIRDVDTVLSANLRRSFWRDDLTVQLLALQGIESGYTLLMPRVTWRFWERFEARVGYLFIAGREQSLVGQFKDNDEAFVWLRYLL